MATPFNTTLRIQRAGGAVESWSVYFTDATSALGTFAQGGAAGTGSVNRILLYPGDTLLDMISPTPTTVKSFTVNIDTVPKYAFNFADFAATVQGRWLGVKASKLCELTINQSA